MRVVVGLLGLWLPQQAVAGIVINEFVADASGADSGYEWVELYNNGSTTIDVSGWVIERAKSSWGVRYTIPSGQTVGAGEYLVIGDEFVAAADLLLSSGQTLDLGNATSSGDALRVSDDSGVVMDTVIYGPNNSDSWTSDDGAVASSVGPKPQSGASTGRFPDGLDTEDSGVDFQVLLDLTPGTENTGGDTGDPPPVTCDPADAVVINEAYPNPSGGDSGMEWLEIYNATAQTMDLSGWRVASGTSSFGSVGTLPVGVEIESGEILLIGQSESVPSVDVIVSGFTLGNASNADAVRLEDCDGLVADTLVYGTPNSDEWIDDTGGIATSLADKPAEGGSIARLIDGQDTDACADDFQATNFPTPGLANDTDPEDCGASTSFVVINEFVPNPAGVDDGFEWVELYNNGSEPVSLLNWALQKSSKGASGYGSALTLEADATLNPGDFFVIGGQSVSEADAVFSKLGLGNGSNGDGVRLVDCAGFTADTVVYGPNNDDAVLGDGEVVATSMAPNPGDDVVLARVQDGYDTNLSGVDFAAGLEGTPGSANPEREPVVCVPSTGDVVLNELLPDPSGVDTGYEWFELYNRSSEEVSVAGWWIAMASQADEVGDVEYRLPGGVTIPAGGFLLVGGEGVEDTDVVGSFSLGNGNGGDGLVLWDCEDQLIDIAIYGDDNADGILDENGIARDPAPLPGNDQSLARQVDGQDAGEASDWFVDHSPTPGASNEQETPGPGQGVGGCGSGGTPGSGCSRSAPSSSGSDPGGCVVVAAPWSVWGGLALSMALWRRRRE